MTAMAAKWLLALGAEPLSANRRASIEAEAPAGLVLDDRGGALAARLPIDGSFEALRAELTSLGPPTMHGVDPTGVSWLAYRARNAVLLVTATAMWLEPFSRLKVFDGIEPDVKTWLAARTAASSKSDADRAYEKKLRRRRIVRTGRVVDARHTRRVARWFGELAQRPIDDAAFEALAGEYGLVLDQDQPRRYLSPDVPSLLVCDGDHAFITLVVVESVERQRPGTFDRWFDAIRTDVTAELGASIEDGEHVYIQRDRWSLFRVADALVLLAAAPDPLEHAERTITLYIRTWPHDRALPPRDGHPADWFVRRDETRG